MTEPAVVDGDARGGGNGAPRVPDGAAGPALAQYLGAVVVADINHHPDQRVAINNGTPNVLS